MALFGDWRDTRAALEAARAKVGNCIHEEKRDWELASAIIVAYREAQSFTCGECEKGIPYGQEIRCIDCKLPMHEACARVHFWPNGRPKKPSDGGTDATHRC